MFLTPFWLFKGLIGRNIEAPTKKLAATLDIVSPIPCGPCLPIRESESRIGKVLDRFVPPSSFAV